jgi:cell fate (sporulation/competence/biofilm development) regulator YmcA (YheA/YmcA/DUF963 family)
LEEGIHPCNPKDKQRQLFYAMYQEIIWYIWNNLKALHLKQKDEVNEDLKHLPKVKEFYHSLKDLYDLYT